MEVKKQTLATTYHLSKPQHSPSRTATPAPRLATFMGAIRVQVLFSGL